MSFWYRHFAPHDQRQRQQVANSSSTSQAQRPNDGAFKILPPTAENIEKARTSSILTPAQRERKQLTVLGAGVTFSVLSVLVTRRATSRRIYGTYPRLFTPSNTPSAPVNGGLEAVEALGLATLNVFSVALAAVGAVMWRFDIVGAEDLKQKAREGMGLEGDAAAEEMRKADREMEEWIVSVLTRKDVKAAGEGVEKAAAVDGGGRDRKI